MCSKWSVTVIHELLILSLLSWWALEKRRAKATWVNRNRTVEIKQKTLVRKAYYSRIQNSTSRAISTYCTQYCTVVIRYRTLVQCNLFCTTVQITNANNKCEARFWSAVIGSRQGGRKGELKDGMRKARASAERLAMRWVDGFRLHAIPDYWCCHCRAAAAVERRR